MTTGQRTYTVTGMSCGRCALWVRNEVAEVAGVERVDVVASAGYEASAPVLTGGSGGHAGY